MKRLAFLLLFLYVEEVWSEEVFQYTLTSKCIVSANVEKNKTSDTWQISFQLDKSSAEKLKAYTKARIGHFFEFVDDDGGRLGIPANILNASLSDRFRLVGFDDKSKASRSLGLINKGEDECRPYLTNT